jgi:hypothetical protein
MHRRPLRSLLLALGLVGLTLFPAPASAAGQRVRIEGELVDTFCSVSGIMFAEGTAHHQCAVWCALGGIPVSIKDKDGQHYLVLRVEDEETNLSNPKVATILTHQVTVDGELVERDGVKYLFINKVADDKGIINLTHDDYGVLPFGN